MSPVINGATSKQTGFCVWQISGLDTVDRDSFNEQYVLRALNQQRIMGDVLQQERYADFRKQMQVTLNEQMLRTE